MFGNFSKKQLKILVGIKLVGLGCFNEAVEYGTGFCTIIGFDQDEILPTYGEWTDSLLGIVVVERYVAIFKEFTQVLFLVDAVGKCPADSTVVCDLVILCFCLRKVVVNHIFKMLLTLLFTVPWGKIVIGVIHVHDLGYHPIGFPGNGAFGCFFAYGLYEFGERSSCMRLI